MIFRLNFTEYKCILDNLKDKIVYLDDYVDIDENHMCIWFENLLTKKGSNNFLFIEKDYDKLIDKLSRKRETLSENTISIKIHYRVRCPRCRRFGHRIGYCTYSEWTHVKKTHEKSAAPKPAPGLVPVPVPTPVSTPVSTKVICGKLRLSNNLPCKIKLNKFGKCRVHDIVSKDVESDIERINLPKQKKHREKHKEVCGHPRVSDNLPCQIVLGPSGKCRIHKLDSKQVPSTVPSTVPNLVVPVSILCNKPCKNNLPCKIKLNKLGKCRVHDKK